MKGECNWVARGLELLMQVSLGAILTMIFLLVVLRYVFHTTIIGGNEATQIAFVFASIFAAALALRNDEHIAVRFFTEKLSREKQNVIAVVRWLLLMSINGVLLVYSIVWIRQTGSFLMPALGLGQWVAQISVPVGCGLGFVYSASGCVSAISAVLGRKRV